MPLNIETMYNALSEQQKKQVEEFIYSIYVTTDKTNLRNSKTDEEVLIAEKAFEELCSMTKHIETKISLNGTEELALAHRSKYESLNRH